MSLTCDGVPEVIVTMVTQENVPPLRPCRNFIFYFIFFLNGCYVLQMVKWGRGALTEPNVDN